MIESVPNNGLLGYDLGLYLRNLRANDRIFQSLLRQHEGYSVGCQTGRRAPELCGPDMSKMMLFISLTYRPDDTSALKQSEADAQSVVLRALCQVTCRFDVASSRYVG